MAGQPDDFYNQLSRSPPANLTDTALAVLWWHDQQRKDAVVSILDICGIIQQHGLGNPNPTRLKKQLTSSRKVLTTKAGLQLKAAARASLTARFAGLAESQPQMDHALGYLPEAVWRNTRAYLERIAEQLNGCYHHAYYDAAAVMLRRLAETLIIEVYEHLGRQNEIKDNSGNYLMLSDLITKATSQTGLSLGRDAKRCLDEVKALGDRSAHNRRFTAKRGDLQKLESLARVGIEELIVLASIRKT